LGYEVEGVVTHKSFSRTNRFTFQFHVSVEGCHWCISTTNALDPSEGSNIEIYDGTNIVKIAKFNPDRVYLFNDGERERSPGSAKRRARNEASTTVTEGPVPEFDSTMIAPLWWAFASGCVFDDSGHNKSLKPLWATGTEEQTPVSAEWTKSSTFPPLPERASFFTDGIVRGLNSSGNPVRIKTQPPGQLFKEAIFESQDFRTMDGMSIPWSFRLVKFRGPLNNNSNAAILTVIEGEVTSVTPTKIPIKATVPANTYVVEKRLSREKDGIEQFVYFSPDGTVLTPEALKQSKQFKRAVRLEAGWK
jgi:hypothetical protein